MGRLGLSKGLDFRDNVFGDPVLYSCPAFSGRCVSGHRRCLRDGIERPLQRVPCALAVVLARAGEVLASSPGSEVYRAVNR